MRRSSRRLRGALHPVLPRRIGGALPGLGRTVHFNLHVIPKGAFRARLFCSSYVYSAPEWPLARSAAAAAHRLFTEDDAAFLKVVGRHFDNDAIPDH